MQLMREHCDLKDNRTMEVYRQMMMDISPV